MTAITIDRDSGLEIVHDAFAGLHRRNGSVIDAEAYLHRSVVNLAIKALRRRQLRTRVVQAICRPDTERTVPR